MIPGDCRPIEILLVEDSPSDTDLTIEALKDFKVRNNVSIVEDGVQAMQFLRREGAFAEAPRPDMIMLDLNLPRVNGYQVLEEIRADSKLRPMPVLVLTTSRQEKDINRSYELGCNSFITKPVGLDQLIGLFRDIEKYWFETAILPSKTE